MGNTLCSNWNIRNAGARKRWTKARSDSFLWIQMDVVLILRVISSLRLRITCPGIRYSNLGKLKWIMGRNIEPNYRACVFSATQCQETRLNRFKEQNVLKRCNWIRHVSRFSLNQRPEAMILLQASGAFCVFLSLHDKICSVHTYQEYGFRGNLGGINGWGPDKTPILFKRISLIHLFPMQIV